MNKVTIHIDGMSCNHCTASVTAALTALTGVETVQVSLEDKNAVVTYDAAKVTADALADVVEEIGFTVTGKTEN